MATSLTRDQIITLLTAVADEMIANKDELAALDAELGDGDLGRTIERGFKAIKESLAGEDGQEPDMGKLLFKEGKAFSNGAPSSFGALFGTALMKGGMALKGKEAATYHDLAEATQAALDALMERGKAKPGDKTMLDAIQPAIQAMRAADAEAEQGVFWRAAADAARKGAEDTKDMQSQIGRASWQQERSTGKMDPGAWAIAMMLDAAARHTEGKAE
ncbi:MAG: dihydroxyacetone kinase subunit DhaL [Anaerolineae bacterium]